MKKKNNKVITIVIGVLILLSMLDILPIIITTMFPSLCYGCTTIGKFQQFLNYKYNLGYVSSFSFILVLTYLFYLTSFVKNNYVKFSVYFLLLGLFVFPVFPLLNVISLILSPLYKNGPFIKDYYTIFPASIKIDKNADIITKEFEEYTKEHQPECIRKTNPGFKIEITKDSSNCWRALYLKKFGKIDDDMIKHFPNTIKLLTDKQIHNAFFSILDPGVEIPPHVGYYKGYLRYHMGIVIPNNDTDNFDDKAYIVCGDEKYIWKTGKGIVFDDVYLHYVKNPTNQKRVVLYLDIKRKSDNFFVNKLNDFGLFLIEHSLLFNIFLKNQHGQNKIEEFNTNIKN